MILAFLLQASPQIDIVAPADPAITVNRPTGPAYIPYMVVLTNNADRDIVAVAVMWTPEGGQPYGVQSESFGSTTKTPVVPARGQAILTPDGFQRSDLIQRGAGMLPVRPHPALEEANHITVNVDAIIFDDGVVLGPDKTGLVDSINARAIAIGRELETVRRATADGQDVTAALRAMMPPPGTNLALLPADPVTNWIIFYAGELSRFPERRDRRVQELQQLPTPPTFFRK
jgi:hypothetical protein